jgi:uncharacterized cupin superfamily protein
VIVHWDDVEPRLLDHGHIRARWADLGRAAGSVGVGVRRILVEPGDVPTPAHVHPVEEEIFYVLGGSGLSWQSGKTYEVRRGDCLVHRAMAEAHTLRAGDDGLEVLAYGHRMRTPGAYLPNSNRYWLNPSWTEAGHVSHPFDAEPELEWPEPSAGPANIVNVADAEADEWSERDAGGVNRALGAEAGSQRTGLNHETIQPGKLNSPPHCHSAEEEIFIVLDGDATLLLGDEEHALRAGHVVARPPGTGVPHAFRAETELTLLSYGTREPSDITYYPRSGVFWVRGIKLAGRLEPVAREEIW